MGDYQKYKCDICRSSKAVEAPHVRDYTGGQVIHICKGCGFVYVKKRRPYDKIAEVWSKQMFGKKKAYTAKSPLMLARHVYVAEFINQNIGLKGKKICDVGAGEGQFLDVVQKNYKAEVFGIEPSEANCRMMKQLKIPCFQGPLEDFSKDEKGKSYKADIVTLMWTLENATDPRDILMGIRNILKPSGNIVVTTGSRLLVPFAKPLNLYLSNNPVDTHPSRFSLNTLTAMLQVCGFNVKFVNPFLNDALALSVIARKTSVPESTNVKGDDYKDVVRFFKKWHKDTKQYKTE